MTDNNDGAVAWMDTDGVPWLTKRTAERFALGPAIPLYPASKVEELRAEVERLRAELSTKGDYVNDGLVARADAAERRVEQLLAVVRYAVGNSEFNSAQFTEMCKHALTGAGAK